MKSHSEQTSIILVLLHAIIYGLYPIIVSSAGTAVQPITFAALSSLVAAITAAFIVTVTGKWKQLANKASWGSLIMITLFIVIIPSVLLFWGIRHTSGANAALLLQSELLFALLITPLFGEKASWIKVFGGMLVFAGALAILYNGTLEFNKGDLLIIASTAAYPLGNFYNKKALTMLSPMVIIGSRYILGSIALLVIAITMEGFTLGSLTGLPWFQIILTGALVFTISKVLIYEGFKKLDITKVTFLNSVGPAFGLLGAIIFLQEVPTVYQWLGLVLMISGVVIAARKASTKLEDTRYGAHVNAE